jgi:D-threonate/D-erythronate kinase
MTTLRLIADDLTGALDTAAQFTGRIGPLPVLLDRTTAAPEGSYVLNLSCRDGDVTKAVACTRDSLNCYSGADLAFKKIDSLLRGHWAAELAEIVKSGMFRRIVVAPAVPAQGRLTRGGLQLLAQSSGDPLLIKDIAAELKRHGVSSRDVDCDVVVLDAASDADLDAIAKRYADQPATLWCGAAGLARALAQQPPRVAQPLNHPHLVIVGSRHPVSLRQVKMFGAARPDCLAPMATEPDFVGRVRTTLEAFGRCVVLPDLPSGLTEMEAAEWIARGMALLSGRLPPLGGLTVVGGETFAAFCRTLKATRLTVTGEFLHGVPASRMEAGLWSGTFCASKSGAFGEPDWLLKHLRSNFEAVRSVAAGGSLVDPLHRGEPIVPTQTTTRRQR